jgi:hypothetical protein
MRPVTPTPDAVEPICTKPEMYSVGSNAPFELETLCTVGVDEKVIG